VGVAAHGRMVKLIVDAFKASQVAAAAGDEEARLAATPLYKVRGVVYFGEQLVRPAYIGQGGRKIQQEIDWFRAPNDDLIPANDIAAAIHAEYRQWVGKKTMTPLDDLRDLAITAAGFAVKGGSSSLQRHGSMADIEAQQTGDHLNRQLGGLNVRGRADVKQVHILGTAHAPAIERA
jgi:hypothetical protein